MDTLDQAEIAQNQPILSPIAASHMRATSPWMVFVGVMFLLSGAMMALSSFAVFASSSKYSSIKMEGMFMFMGAFYLLGGILFAVAGGFLVSSGSKLGTFAKYPSTTALEAFTAKQKYFWIMVGIFWILSIALTIGMVAMAGRMSSLVGNSLQ